MFRKMITRLVYSPAVAEELIEYARKLRHEEIKRQVGLIFLALALIIQMFAVFFPPESANAGDMSDFIDGGFGSVEEFLIYYDQDTKGIQSLFSSLGITRSDIERMRVAPLPSRSDFVIWKMASRFDDEDLSYDYIKNDGTPKTIYYHQLDANNPILRDDRTFSDGPMYVGSSGAFKTFALIPYSGNLITTAAYLDDCTTSHNIPPPEPVTLSLHDIQRCQTGVSTSLSAQNLRTGRPASSHEAEPTDRIVYALSVKNDATRGITLSPEIRLTDVLEYAQLIDKGGGTFDPTARELKLPAVSISPGATYKWSFVTRVRSEIPSTASGESDRLSYDCVMSSSFGNTYHISVSCPTPKLIERIASELPPTSPRTNLFFAVVLAVIALYFYQRTKQLRTELRLIRHNYHQGSL